MKIKIKLRTLLTFGCVILSLFLFPIVSVWKKSRVQDMVRENEQIRENIKKARNTNLATRYLRDRLTARVRIESVAKSDLGLIYPAAADVYLVVRVQPLKQGDRGFEKVFANR